MLKVVGGVEVEQGGQNLQDQDQVLDHIQDQDHTLILGPSK